MKLTIYILFSVILSSCYTSRNAKRCAKCPVQIITKDSIYTEVKDTTIFRDSIVELPADSAWYYALIECENNKPVIKQEKSKQGNLKFKASSKSDSTSLQIKIDCETEKRELAIKLEEKFRKEFTSSAKTESKTITRTVNIIKWWQWGLMGCGVLGLIYAGFRIGFWIAKKQIPFLS